MVITHKDFNTRLLKKYLLAQKFPVDRILQTYHNKHKNGSGNFGGIIVVSSETEGNHEKWFRYHGVYNSIKVITSLRFGEYSGAGAELSPLNYDTELAIFMEIESRLKQFLLLEMSEQANENPVCQSCGGFCNFIGNLAQTSWFRCEACGLEFGKNTVD